MRPYDGYTQPEQRLAARNNLALYSELSTLLGPNWVKSILDPLAPSDTVPPLFWTLTDSQRIKIIYEALQSISQKQTSIGHEMSQLKLHDDTQVNSLLRELEIYRLIEAAGNPVQWKPAPPKVGGKRSPYPDLQTQINGQNCFVEVLTIHDPQKSRSEKAALSKLDQEINDLGYRYNYRVCYEIKGIFEEKMLSSASELLIQKFATGCDKLTFDFNFGGQIILKFTADKISRRGYHAATSWGGMIPDPSGRFKNILLDKQDKIQFPQGDSLNGYVIVLDSFMFGDHYYFRNALMGTEFTTYNTLTQSTSTGRMENGVIHDSTVINGKTRGQLLIENVDFYISLKTRNGIITGDFDFVVNDIRNKVQAAEIKRFCEKAFKL